MGYGAVFSEDQRGDDNEGFERALADFQAALRHPDVGSWVDEGGRTSLHRRDTLIVAVEDLDDRRLVDNRLDLGITDESYEAARETRRGRRPLPFAAVDLEPGQSIVAVSRYLRSLGGRRPLRLGPDHVLFPMQGIGFGPASPPKLPSSAPAARTLKAHASKAKAAVPTVKVAVLDTGYVPGDPVTDACTEYAEPDHLWEPVSRQFRHWVGGHGTHVAGVVAGAAGGAVRIRHYNVSESFSGTLPLVSDTVLAAAVADAIANKCRILNLSLGGPTAIDLGLPATALVLGRSSGERKARGEQADDAVVVASAGNEATTHPMFPAAMKGVVAVGALDAGGNRADFSNHGWWVDCATVGVDVLGPYADTDDAVEPNFDGYAEWSGTSFAAPFVAGRIAAAMNGQGIGSARIAAATVLSLGSPLDPTLGLGVRIS